MNTTRRKRAWIAAGVLATLALTVIVIVGLILASRNAEPTLVLTGVVRDATTNEPIAGATVADDGYGPEPRRNATTDSSGRYRYVTWPEEHSIVATAPDYAPQRKCLVTSFLQNEREKTLDFEMSRQQ